MNKVKKNPYEIRGLKFLYKRYFLSKKSRIEFLQNERDRLAEDAYCLEEAVDFIDLKNKFRHPLWMMESYITISFWLIHELNNHSEKKHFLELTSQQLKYSLTDLIDYYLNEYFDLNDNSYFLKPEFSSLNVIETYALSVEFLSLLTSSKEFFLAVIKELDDQITTMCK